MPSDTKNYLKDLKEKLTDSNKKHQAYLLPKLDLITNANSKKQLMENVRGIIDENITKFADSKIAIISYAMFSSKNDFGLASINATIQDVNENGSISRKNILNNSIYYTEKEILDRGIKGSDYKKLIKFLINGKIVNNPLKIYTISEIL